MSIRIGDLDVANEVVALNFEVAKLGLILEYIANHNRTAIVFPPQTEMTAIEAR